MSTARFFDGGSYVTVAQSITPRLQGAGTVDGSSFDRCAPGDQSYDSGILEVSLGAVAGTPDSETIDCAIYDSADNSSFAAVASTYGGPIAITQATAGAQVVTVKFNAVGLRRYVRAHLVVAFVNGTSPTVGVSANLIMLGAMKVPTP